MLPPFAVAGGVLIAAFQIGAGIVLGITVSVFAANSDTGLDGYRAGIVTVIGVAVPAVLVSVGGVVRHRRLGTRQPATAPQPTDDP